MYVRLLRRPLSLAALTALPLASLDCSSAAVAPLAVADAGSTVADASKDAKVDATRDGGGGKDGSSHDGAAEAAEASGPTTLLFDLTADTTQAANFYSFPFPSDLRLNATGAPDYSGLPNPANNPQVANMVPIASSRLGFSTLAVGYFAFSAPMGTLDPTAIIPPGPGSNILLLDVDPASPDRGKFFPTVAWTPVADAYTAPNVVTVAARPGFVLFPKRKYAFVIRKEQLDANKKPLAVPPDLATLASGGTPNNGNGAAAAALYAPLFETLKTVGVDATDVAAATVFTTGDEVAVTQAMSNELVEKYPAPITGLSVCATGANCAAPPPDAGAVGGTYPRVCELQGVISLPQFQTGSAPFATSGGTFTLDVDGVPIKQGTLEVPLAISIPTTGPMPAAGYPLVLYFHGSGGVSTEFIDRGPILQADGGETPGQGPAYVLAPFGFAMAGSALPQNPQRVADAGETEYLQITNLASLLGTFRQGIIEQRMLLAALSNLQISTELVQAGCPAVQVPGGGQIHFDTQHLFSQGQSMGGMYTNLITAVEPTFKGALPTGAGGFWTYFLFQSAFVPNANGLLGVVLGVPGETLTFMHPALSMVETGWEAVDPLVSVPRLSRNPLPGTSPRPIYEPVGQNDSYFSNDVYNAVALAYGHREVGDIVWQGMQTALAEENLSGILPYPATQDVTSLETDAGHGGKYTGVVVQYNADTITGNGHYIYAQLDAVKYQYGCFLSSMLRDGGVAVVPAPATLGTPCP